jgi:hypothetical protein
MRVHDFSDLARQSQNTVNKVLPTGVDELAVEQQPAVARLHASSRRA